MKKWNILPSDPHKDKLAKSIEVSPIVAQLLINRDITDEEESKSFLFPQYSKLDDPFKLKDMDLAVNRIKQAQANDELVMVFGDYDVDGVTSSALLTRLLKKLDIKTINYIPHRIDEGYGLNVGIAEIAKSKNVDLLITVDCGINAFEEVDAITAKGIDVVVIDHHTPDGNRVPKCCAVIDPKRPDCDYPFKHFAAVGLVAKVMQAFLEKIPEDELDLIAIGTIADVVKLRGENRVFAKYGLSRITRTNKHGLIALLEQAKVRTKEFKAFHVGFVLGPRINAAGRMGSASTSLELLLSNDYSQALALAQTLESHNQDRQKLQRSIVDEAIRIVEEDEQAQEKDVLVLYKEGWHKGVVGIVASRIMDKFGKPAIVISVEDGVGVGSARSNTGLHLYDALAHCSDHLENFGGHKCAAGLTLKHERIDDFVDAINEFAKDNLEQEELLPTLDIDCEVNLSKLTLELVEMVNSLEPYGEGNPMPIFCTKKLKIKNHPQKLGRDTLKLWVTDGQVSFSAVGFGMGSLADGMKMGDTIDLAYNLGIDDWNKAPVVQLMIKDIKTN